MLLQLRVFSRTRNIRDTGQVIIYYPIIASQCYTLFLLQQRKFLVDYSMMYTIPSPKDIKLVIIINQRQPYSCCRIQIQKITRIWVLSWLRIEGRELICLISKLVIPLLLGQIHSTNQFNFSGLLLSCREKQHQTLHGALLECKHSALVLEMSTVQTKDQSPSSSNNKDNDNNNNVILYHTF